MNNEIYNERYLSKLHRDILDIMDVIDNLCEKNSLHYYLTGGSLLGAIRHGGFIPWDDDLDIVMPREDFDRFLEICKTQLPRDFHIKWITNDKNYFLMYAKFCRHNTSFCQNVHKNTSDYGIFVDIFPLDIVAGYSPEIEKRKAFVKKCANALFEQVADNNYTGLKQAILRCTPAVVLHMMAMRVMKKDNKKNGAYYANYSSQYPIKRWTVPIKAFGDGRKIKFEDREYIVPEDYTTVLESVFGKSYMQLPPPEKRKTHYPVHVTFSDGEEMTFSKTEKKLRIQDTLTD